MKYRYFTCDVFTNRRFGGNQLAVLPDAGGLDAGQMQQVAREFNYSETTFVLPPKTAIHARCESSPRRRKCPLPGTPILALLSCWPQLVNSVNSVRWRKLSSRKKPGWCRFPYSGLIPATSVANCVRPRSSRWGIFSPWKPRPGHCHCPWTTSLPIPICPGSHPLAWTS